MKKKIKLQYHGTYQACPCLWNASLLDPNFMQAISSQCKRDYRALIGSQVTDGPKFNSLKHCFTLKSQNSTQKKLQVQGKGQATANQSVSQAETVAQELY